MKYIIFAVLAVLTWLMPIVMGIILILAIMFIAITLGKAKKHVAATQPEDEDVEAQPGQYDIKGRLVQRTQELDMILEKMRRRGRFDHLKNLRFDENEEDSELFKVNDLTEIPSDDDLQRDLNRALLRSKIRQSQIGNTE